jgi:hypothetical protein
MAGSDPAKVRKELFSSTIVFPGDEETQDSIINGNLYTKRMKQYLLGEYERHVSTGDVLSVLPEITVDHLMPQSYKGEWQKVVTRNDFDLLVNTWGNLVPLSNEANSAKGAKSWDEAREMLRTETVFSSTKQVYMNHDVWNAETIRTRSKKIAVWALERWPFFGELLNQAAEDPERSGAA